MLFKITRTSLSLSDTPPHSKAFQKKCNACGRKHDGWFITLPLDGLVKFARECEHSIVITADDEPELEIYDERRE